VIGVWFTPLAETDLEDIGDYIAQDNPARALIFIQEIRAQCQKIGKSPLAYRARPELGSRTTLVPINRIEILNSCDRPATRSHAGHPQHQGLHGS